MKNKENLFMAVGIEKDFARFLTLVISKPSLKVDELPSELGLSQEDCELLVQKLVSRKTIEITPERFIRIMPNFVLNISRELENSTEKFLDQLRATRFLIGEKFVEEIQSSFQKEGYKIKKEFRRKFRPIRGVEFSYRFIAEKFYRFGVIIFEPEILEQMKRVGLPYRYFPSFVLDLKEGSGCIGTFIFFDPELDKKEISRIRGAISKVERTLPPSQRKKRFFFIHNPREDIGEFLVNILNEIEIRHDTVEKNFKELKNELKTAKDLIVENSMMISQLDSLVSGQYLPQLRRNKEFTKFVVPVKSVVDREERNLEIFERKYDEERTSIKREIDDFDNRLILPNPSDLKKTLEKVKKLKSKFIPIRHELRFLIELLLIPYMAERKPIKINPFILTEPNNIESFTINQDSIKRDANKFFQYLMSGGSNLLFVVGAAGTGKTHILKHIFYSRAKKLDIWPIYIDCPMKYDIVSSLFAEIVQERNFPKKIHQFLPPLRKSKVSTGTDLAEIIKKLYDMIHSQGYKGLILMIDELENSLPYTYDMKEYRNLRESEEPPLALKQLKEILSSDSVKDTGFVFAFRNHILPEIKNNLQLKDFDSFTLTPEIHDIQDFEELIKLRYKTWGSKQIKFQRPVIEEITLRTDSNIRHTIQYFRALYQQAFEDRKRTVSIKTLEKIGKIPLFSY